MRTLVGVVLPGIADRIQNLEEAASLVRGEARLGEMRIKELVDHAQPDKGDVTLAEAIEETGRFLLDELELARRLVAVIANRQRTG